MIGLSLKNLLVQCHTCMRVDCVRMTGGKTEREQVRGKVIAIFLYLSFYIAIMFPERFWKINEECSS